MSTRRGWWQSLAVAGAAGAFVMGVWYGVSLERSRQPWARERLLSAALDSVRVNFLDSLPEDEVMRRAVSGMLRELKDPYAALLEGEGMTEYRGTLHGESQGVGMLLRLREHDVLVRRVEPGSPAALAGIAAGDVVQRVNGQPAVEAWSMLRPSSTTADRKLGSSDTLRISVKRNGSNSPVDAVVVRASWRSSPVPRAFLAATGVGYVRLANSATGSTDSVASAVERLLHDGARSLVLDLRGNKGGLYDEGVRTAALFLNRGDVVASLDGRGARSRDVQRARDSRWPSLPMVVLVDRLTASSAELVAAALRDHGRALLVGDRTYGKGVVQRVVHISPELSLRLTTARWVPPSGVAVEPRREEGGRTTGGLEPDVWVASAAPIDLAAVPATLSPARARTMSDLVDRAIAQVADRTGYDAAQGPLPELEALHRDAIEAAARSVRGSDAQQAAFVGDGTRVAVRRVLEAAGRDTVLWRYAASDDGALLAALDVVAPGFSTPAIGAASDGVHPEVDLSRAEQRELAQMASRATAVRDVETGDSVGTTGALSGSALAAWTRARFAGRQEIAWDTTLSGAGTTRPGPRVQGTLRPGQRDTLVAVHFAAGAFAPAYPVGAQVMLADPSGGQTSLVAVVVDRFAFRAPTVPRLPGASYARSREWRLGWAYLVALPQRVATAHTHGFGGWRLLDVQ